MDRNALIDYLNGSRFDGRLKPENYHEQNASAWREYWIDQIQNECERANIQNVSDLDRAVESVWVKFLEYESYLVATFTRTGETFQITSSAVDVVYNCLLRYKLNNLP